MKDFKVFINFAEISKYLSAEVGDMDLVQT